MSRALKTTPRICRSSRRSVTWASRWRHSPNRFTSRKTISCGPPVSVAAVARSARSSGCTKPHEAVAEDGVLGHPEHGRDRLADVAAAAVAEDDHEVGGRVDDAAEVRRLAPRGGDQRPARARSETSRPSSPQHHLHDDQVRDVRRRRSAAMVRAAFSATSEVSAASTRRRVTRIGAATCSCAVEPAPPRPAARRGRPSPVRGQVVDEPALLASCARTVGSRSRARGRRRRRCPGRPARRRRRAGRRALWRRIVAVVGRIAAVARAGEHHLLNVGSERASAGARRRWSDVGAVLMSGRSAQIERAMLTVEQRANVRRIAAIGRRPLAA